MSRGKLKRFAENALRDNILEPGKPKFETIKGHWQEHFKNDNPLILELTCGRGEYTIGLARLHPNCNHIGIDLRDEKRRVTHPRYLALYKYLLGKEGWVRLKTDNTGLFEYTLQMLKNANDIQDLQYTYDLYHSDLRPECYEIRTRYEQKFNEQGHDIKYLKFRFKG